MAERPLYFDTPIFTQRVFGSPGAKTRVEETVATRDVFTTRYVREQFKVTFLAGAILLHSLLSQHRDRGRVMRDLHQFPVTHGEGSKASEVWAALMDSGNDGDVPDMLETLERWIELEILLAFDNGIKIDDGTACCHSAPSWAKDVNGIYSLPVECNLRKRKDCTIEKFWEPRHRHLKVIGEIDPTGVPDHVKRAKEAAAAAAENRGPVRGQKCHYNLSDAVIVCETPAYAEVATTNGADMRPLAEAVNEGRTILDWPMDRASGE